MAPQTQEIPLLLLHGSVMAACLCVYFCGTEPVCMCQSRTGFFRSGGGGGGYCTAGPNQETNQPQSPRAHTREVKQTQPQPLSQDTSSYSYWLTHEAALFFCVLVPAASPHSALLFKESLEVWPLISDLSGKAEKAPQGDLGERKSFLSGIS